ncbi:hypothetical protein UlMin_040867 [Ulmus minor]
MRNKLHSLLGRSFKTNKFKPIVSLAISRLAVFKHQREVRGSQARSDVVQLLQQGYHERALLRVEHVIKEQNLLDVYVMIEGYCNLLIERVHLIEQTRECPQELREAIAGMLHASSRCGDFPELQEIRALFTSQFGKEFVASAVELRNQCSVNLTLVQKLSTRQPSLESRMKVLKEIASENSITLQLEEASSFPAEGKLDVVPISSATSSGTKSGSDMHIASEEIGRDDMLSDSVKGRKKFRDATDAAQAAFESAAYAAAAARAAVELSRTGSNGPDNQDSPGSQGRKSSFKRVDYESEKDQVPGENQAKELKRPTPSSSSSLTRHALKATAIGTSSDANPSGKEIVFDESDSDTDNEQNDVLPAHTQIPSRFQAGQNVESSYPEHDAAGPEVDKTPRLNLEKGPFSMRTRKVRGY